jgi:hypothetical protein
VAREVGLEKDRPAGPAPDPLRRRAALGRGAGIRFRSAALGARGGGGQRRRGAEVVGGSGGGGGLGARRFSEPHCVGWGGEGL